MNIANLVEYTIATVLCPDDWDDVKFFLWCQENIETCKRIFKKSRSILSAIVILKKEWQQAN